MKRLLLDANILFTAAHNPNGKAAFVIEQAAAGVWQAVTCGYALEEARRNLQRKFPDRLAALEGLMQGVEQVPAVRGEGGPPELPEKDRPIYQAALACGATHLLTGDRKDFGPLMNCPQATGGMIVQTVAEFLQALG